MTNKRGQVTTFVLIGIVISLLVIFAIVSNNVFKQQGVPFINPKIESVKFFVDDCLKNTAEEGIYLISLQGGYYDGAIEYEKTSIKIPYYYKNGKVNIPTRKIIEKEIAKYIGKNIDVCLNDFKQFKEAGYNVNNGNKIIKIEIGNEVIVTMDYPMRVSKDDISGSISKFEQSIPVNIENMRVIAIEIINEQKKTPKEMPIGFIIDLAANNNFTFLLTPFEKNSIVVTLILKEPGISRGEVYYNFLIENEGENM